MTDQPNESSAEVTERELLVQTLRLQEQASVSNISQLVECRKQLELARLQCQMLQNTIAGVKKASLWMRSGIFVSGTTQFRGFNLRLHALA